MMIKGASDAMSTVHNTGRNIVKNDTDNAQKDSQSATDPTPDYEVSLFSNQITFSSADELKKKFKKMNDIVNNSKVNIQDIDKPLDNGITIKKEDRPVDYLRKYVCDHTKWDLDGFEETGSDFGINMDSNYLAAWGMLNRDFKGIIYTGAIKYCPDMLRLKNGTYQDINYYNKLFANETQDVFDWKCGNHWYTYTDSETKFLQDMRKSTGKAVIGDVGGAGRNTTDYAINYGYNGRLVYFHKDLIDIMSDNRQDDDIWKNVVNGNYRNLNQMINAIDNKGDHSLPKALREKIDYVRSRDGYDHQFLNINASFKTDFHEDVWIGLYKNGYKGPKK